jgi:hypothetical protein
MLFFKYIYWATSSVLILLIKPPGFYHGSCALMTLLDSNRLL